MSSTITDDKEDVGQSFVSFVCLSASYSLDSNEWIIDSGASQHMTNRNDWMKNGREVNDNVTIANDSKLCVKRIGNVELKLEIDNGCVSLKIHDVLYVPELFTNLLSVSRLAKNGLTVIFDESGCKIYDKQKKLIGKGVLINDIFKLDQWVEPIAGKAASVSTSNHDEIELWHQRFAHLGYSTMCKMNDNFVDTIKSESESMRLCEICMKGKQCRLPFGPISSRTSEVLELIHSDVCGELPESFGGFRYFLTFIDDFSRKGFTYFIKNRSESFEKFNSFRSFVENQTKKKIKIFRSDNGGEYFGKDFVNYLTSIGIFHQSSALPKSQKNGLAERMNRTLVERGRCMLFDGNLNLKFWADAISTASYLVNRSPSRGLIEKSPQEIWTSKKTNVSHLRVFGCKAVMHVPMENRKMFDSKSKVCIMIGYSETSKAYRLMDPQTKVFISRDVEFMEDERCMTCSAGGDELSSDNFIYVFDVQKDIENVNIKRNAKDGDSDFISPRYLATTAFW